MSTEHKISIIYVGYKLSPFLKALINSDIIDYNVITNNSSDFQIHHADPSKLLYYHLEFTNVLELKAKKSIESLSIFETLGQYFEFYNPLHLSTLNYLISKYATNINSSNKNIYSTWREISRSIFDHDFIYPIFDETRIFHVRVGDVEYPVRQFIMLKEIERKKETGKVVVAKSKKKEPIPEPVEAVSGIIDLDKIDRMKLCVESVKIIENSPAIIIVATDVISLFILFKSPAFLEVLKRAPSKIALIIPFSPSYKISKVENEILIKTGFDPNLDNVVNLVKGVTDTIIIDNHYSDSIARIREKAGITVLVEDLSDENQESEKFLETVLKSVKLNLANIKVEPKKKIEKMGEKIVNLLSSKFSKKKLDKGHEISKPAQPPSKPSMVIPADEPSHPQNEGVVWLKKEGRDVAPKIQGIQVLRETRPETEVSMPESVDVKEEMPAILKSSGDLNKQPSTMHAVETKMNQTSGHKEPPGQAIPQGEAGTTMVSRDDVMETLRQNEALQTSPREQEELVKPSTTIPQKEQEQQTPAATVPIEMQNTTKRPATVMKAAMTETLAAPGTDVNIPAKETKTIMPAMTEKPQHVPEKIELKPDSLKDLQPEEIEGLIIEQAVLSNLDKAITPYYDKNIDVVFSDLLNLQEDLQLARKVFTTLLAKLENVENEGPEKRIFDIIKYLSAHKPEFYGEIFEEFFRNYVFQDTPKIDRNLQSILCILGYLHPKRKEMLMGIIKDVISGDNLIHIERLRKILTGFIIQEPELNEVLCKALIDLYMEEMEKQQPNNDIISKLYSFLFITDAFNFGQIVLEELPEYLFKDFEEMLNKSIPNCTYTTALSRILDKYQEGDY
ncbi:MAG: hypothetical protein ACTSXP_06105, partial [Promethearchaeota archaeon]